MDLKALVTTIRALIISRPQMTTLQDLMKEYRDLEGDNIPFRKFGFPSLEDFLVSTGSFMLRSYSGQTIVSAILKEESAHLVKMIAAQKKPKAKAKSRGTSVYRPDFNRSVSAPRYPANHRFPAAPLIQRPPNHMQHRMLSKPKATFIPFSKEIRKEAPPISSQMPKLIPLDPVKMTNSTGAIPKSSVNKRIQGFEVKLTNDARSVSSKNGFEKSKNERLVRQASLPTPTSSPASNKVGNGFSVSKSMVPPAGYTEPEVSISVTPEPEEPISLTPEPKEVILDKDTKRPVEDLESYCKYMGYNDPYYGHTFVAFKGGNKMFQCRVTVMNKTYCSYPEHCPSEEEAQRVAARLAINRLILEEEIKKFPICQDDDVSIAEKLLEILKDYPRGILATAIPEYFRMKYGMSLSGNWLNIVHKYYIFSVEKIGERQILYTDINDRPSRPSSDLINDIDVTVFESLVLPWSEDLWTIQITNPVSTTEIYGQIVGEQYSKRLSSHMVDIEMAMINKLPPRVEVGDVEEGRIYLTINNTNWSRVRVEGIDRENGRYHCFCVDTGEQDTYSELFECSSHYLKVPHQAICFSLAFLENFEGNPYVTQHLDTILSRSEFIARIVTKQKEFELNSNADGDIPIKVVLMDPKCPDMENNVNQIILQKICNETPAPELERAALTLVKITHVSEIGDVYCQTKHVGLNYIQRLTDALVVDESKMKLRRPLEREDYTIRYLVHDRANGKWYRAVPEVPVSILETTHRMFCIDFGFVVTANDEDIYQLEPLSQALCKFPALAIKCRLYQLQNMTPPIVSRIKGLLSEDSECIMKMMVSTSAIPQVNCYMRHQGGTFFCINESIKIEEELGRQNDSKLSSARNSPSSSSNSPDSENFSRLKMTHKSLPRIARTLSGGQKIEDYELPAIGSTFSLSVALISNPSNFIVQPCDDKNIESFRELTKELQKVCSASKEQPISAKSLEIGQAYAVFVEKDRLWRRGILDLVINNQDVQVTLCDYGEKLLVNSNNIKVLPNDLRKLPKQAIRCSLYGIKPTHGDWTTDDILRFRGLASNTKKKFFSIIKNVSVSPVDGGKIIEIMLLDTSTGKDAIFNDLFIKEQRALHI